MWTWIIGIYLLCVVFGLVSMYATLCYDKGVHPGYITRKELVLVILVGLCPLLNLLMGLVTIPYTVEYYFDTNYWDEPVTFEFFKGKKK